MNFEEPPMIPREDLPNQHQPHRSFYGKLTCYLNGVNPFPPGHKNNPAKNNDTLNIIERGRNDISVPDQEMGKKKVEEELKKNEEAKGDFQIENIE